jgi:exonuclease VII small subunit
MDNNSSSSKTDELDPAEQVLLAEENAKKKRKQEETRFALDRIMRRISMTMHEYNKSLEDEDGDETGGGNDEEDDDDDKGSIVNFEHINDPVKLYELLSDSRIRAKYENRLTIVLVGMEESNQVREENLLSLDDFFKESKSGKFEKLIEEVESGGINIEESTEGFENAMVTTMHAATKLSALVKGVRQLLSKASEYPDNKKGRKKMEKALIRAENEIESMSATIETFRVALDKSKDDQSDLQKAVEFKEMELATIRKTADQAKKTSESLKTELTIATATLQRTQLELKDLKANKPPAQMMSDSSAGNEGKIKELEKSLESLEKANKELKIEKELQQKQTQQAIDDLNTKHEEEINEIKMHYEEKLQALSNSSSPTVKAKKTRRKDNAMEDDSASYRDDISEIMELEQELENEIENELEMKEETNEGIEQHDRPPVQETSDKEGESLSDGEGIVIATLQREFAERENALKNKIATMKEKYKKALNSLKLKFEEAQKKLNEREEYDLATDTAQAKLNEMEDITNNLTEEKNFLSSQNEEQKMKINQLEEIIQQYEYRLNEVQLHGKQMATHSTQWSEKNNKSERSTSPSSSPSVSLGERSLVQMEEVFYPDETDDGHHVLSAGPSVDNVHHSPAVQPHASPLHGSQSPTQGNTMEFPALAAITRLSRQSQASSTVTLNHPIVQEWNKGYDQVMKFKENIIDLIKSSGTPMSQQLNEIVQDLEGQTQLKMTDSRDAQGQVAQMRFTLSLTLHQLDNALRELLTLAITHPATSSGPTTSDAIKQHNRELANLKQKMKYATERHQEEILQSQDTITNLTVKIEGLKMEMGRLNHLLAQANENRVGVIFFTSLDAKRNQKALEEVKMNESISQEQYETISSDMEDYVTIPARQFQTIAQKLKQENQMEKAITNVQKGSFSPEHAQKIISMIKHIQGKRKILYDRAIDELSTKRLKLAKNLQAALSTIEKETGVFLIKPMYPTHPTSSFMIPLKRAPPIHSTIPPSTRQSARSAVSYKSPVIREPSGQETPHPTLRLINDIHMANKSTRHSDRPPDYTPPQTLKHQSQAMDEATKWHIANSRTSTAPTHSFSPVTPRLVELETCRMREPGHLLKSFMRNKETLRKHTPAGGGGGITLPPIYIPAGQHEEQQMTS